MHTSRWQDIYWFVPVICNYSTYRIVGQWLIVYGVTTDTAAVQLDCAVH